MFLSNIENFFILLLSVSADFQVLNNLYLIRLLTALPSSVLIRVDLIRR